jgi:hypothetical protein
MSGKPFWRRQREARQRRPRWNEFPDDPENAQRKRRAEAEMRAFDKLGERARVAISDSRFDAEAPRIWSHFGGPHADDEAVARRVRADDDKFSGAFGPKYPKGI